MPKKLIAERDALLKALELGHHQINEVQKGHQAAEQKIQSLEAQLRVGENRLDSVHRQFEKRAAEIAACGGHGHEHIQELEHKIGLGLAENQRLKALLIEVEAANHTDHEYVPAPKRGVHHEPDSFHIDTHVEIEASVPHRPRCH